MILAICSAPLQLRLHPVKSTIRILEEYLTLWQMTEIYENGSCENIQYNLEIFNLERINLSLEQKN